MKILPKVGEIWTDEFGRYEIVSLDRGWVRFRLVSKGRIPQPCSVAHIDGGRLGWFFRDGFAYRYQRAE